MTMKKGSYSPLFPDDRMMLKSEHVEDPYARRMKPRQPIYCRDCGAVFAEGRWRWGGSPPDAEPGECPACRRIKDNYPAGQLILSGTFLALHKKEILSLVRHEAMAEKVEHPLHRLMDVVEEEGQVVVETTDIHLPRRIGRALEHAYKGAVELQYDKQAYFARGSWHRD
jgi:hypothetical protein